MAERKIRTRTGRDNYLVTSEREVLTLEKINAERINSVEKRLAQLDDKIERILVIISKKNGTDWRAIGLVVTVVALIGGLLGQQIGYNTMTIHDHKILDGHFVAMQKHAKADAKEEGRDEFLKVQIAHLQQGIIALDDRLQLEAKLQNDTLKETIRALDEKLQIEFGRNSGSRSLSSQG